jgi:Spy/CpxP family protein refolding chaperone
MRTGHLAGLALALTMSGAGLVSAQTTAQAPAAPTTPPAAQTVAPGHHRHFARRDFARRALFHDVKLTADQRTQLKSMHNRFRTDARPLMEQFRSERQAARQAKTNGDTAALADARAKLAATRTQVKALRDRYLTDARGILTPDQQAQFDKNVTAIKARMERHREARAQQRKS